nr:hypothetical protein [Tanacetum cinerariifolium]
MAAPVISFSSDLSYENVGSSILRVILIDFISIEVPVAQEDIPIGRLYRTHPGRPCRDLTTRKSVRPLPSYRLKLRFVYLTLARTPRYSEAYRHWMSVPLSTMYPPTTSESSARDSFSESSIGPSRKRCRSPAATVTSSIHALRALVPSHADLLPPRKRFKDSISPEDSVEEDINTDVLADIKADATTIRVTADMDRVGSEEFDCWWRERASLLDQVASLEMSNARLQGTLRMKSTRGDRF